LKVQVGSQLKGEIITGWRVRNCLQSLIDSRHPCQAKIPHRPFCRDAWVAKIHRTEDSDCLFIDGVGGFEQALPPFQDRKIALKDSDVQVFFCRFHTGVIKTSPQGIWVEYPEAIYRMQRRAFHRVKAQGGTEVVFPRGAGKKVRARVRQPISETQRLLLRKFRKGPLLMETEETSKA
jgi:hypothetical protein